MMKKKIIWLCFCIILISCDKEIHITQPIIVLKGNAFKINDTIPITVIEHAEIDGSREEPDYYKWEIISEKQDIHYSDFPNKSEIEWIPDSAGYFFVRLKIGYDSNKSITLLEEIEVNLIPESLQQDLIGEWIGDAETSDGFKWKVGLTFDSTGHYFGQVLELSDSSHWPIGPFYHGCYLTDNYEFVTWVPDVHEPIEAPGSPLYRQTCNQLAEDIPCTYLKILEVKDNKGFGDLASGFEYEVWGRPYHYDCSLRMTIGNLTFSDRKNSLFFDMIDRNSEDDQWFAKYNLKRVK